ncbi:hypothetical protein A2884_00170 [Candidatus Saccharibacteria bacterium RIFCSPHIGHO2_01_FULL_48_12]|nr:MAG: hypothetical protein A2884_00170 [Candidatus Saccharibacteria bacterium RIFCSPHIGHO2_01_FULL_48_12]OGL36353.1 MAG: hypothetical protein A3F38_01470 [Candidatus Saccharibacteria bacterium RIFCSPHIGHO2_12_FULL_48_21]
MTAMDSSQLLSKRVLGALGLLSGLCIFLYVLRVLATGTDRYLFTAQNLALAWVALLFGWLLTRQLTKSSWLSWQAIGLSLLFVVFLPNSWYVLTDFWHVEPTGEISLLYDISLVFTLVVCGFALGFISLYLIHIELMRRLSRRLSHLIIATTLLISSFGIYLGRDLRWNTWDVVSHPEGLIINVSDRVVDPLEHPRAITVTILFFVLLSTMYAAIWLASGPHKSERH